MSRMLAVVAVAPAGCATQPIPTADAVPVPAEIILAVHLTRQAPGAVEVIIKRDGGILGSGCPSRLFVNGTPAAELRAGKKIALYLPEGEHILSAQPPPPSFCGGGMLELRAVIKAGTRASFRIGFGSAVDFTLQPTAF